jgi:hypothetical protein
VYWKGERDQGHTGDPDGGCRDLVGQFEWPRDKGRDRRIPQAERLPKTMKVIAPESGRRHERFSKI